MSWFNYYGLIIVALIMLPNIIFAIKYKDGFGGSYKNKCAEIFEQIGRYDCVVFMVFNIPYTYLNFWFNGALLTYIIVNGTLCTAYLIFWAIFWNKSNMARAITLSVLPSCIFLFSGVMLLSVPLLVFSIIFAVCHILISCKNAI